MMKYSDYIKLSPNYESVVDLDAEERNPSLWQDYIVHEDMKKAIEAVCMTMNWEDNDKRRSFWIHGAYGTGKSYAAIVLKHLFEDSLNNIETFLGRAALVKFKTRFMRIREKGDFLVVWKSGTSDIKSGTHLMMEMEVKIKEKLKQKFGEKAYYGTSSLINAAKEAVANEAINWNGIFNNPIYDLSDEYVDLDDFRKAIANGDLSAVTKVKSICDDLHFSMFADAVEKFEEWLKDIIAGNKLIDTGIFFIWDEFTGFLRDCGDDNVLQRLSEFCKQPKSPFFMCLIVHRDPTWVSQLGGETYQRILHRYHELEFHITESAAYDLIGDSIVPHAGMGPQWDEVKRQLLTSIQKWKLEFDFLDQNVNINERMIKLCPIHPMTLSILTTVAQNFGASQRTLFRFMKDRAESSQGVGFIHYIENNNPDEWKWLTVDYLWDYFFIRNSDVRDFNAEARKVIQHFQKNADSVSDEYAMRVFKASLLLIAVVSGSNISSLYSKKTRTSGRISATTSTLYKCFRGQLEQPIIDEYLSSFEAIGLLRLDKQTNNDIRVELPYTGSADAFEAKFAVTEKQFTRHALFAEKGIFSKALENIIWDSTRATYGRVYVGVCSHERGSLNARLGEVKKEIAKYPYKIGLLIISIAEPNEYASFQAEVKKLAAESDSGRLIVALLREPCTADIIDRWHRAVTHMDLSAEEGKSASKNKFEAEAASIVSAWAAAAAESQIFACYGDVQFAGIYGKNDLMKRIEKDVLYSVFPAALERLVTVNTAFKKCNDGVVITALTKGVNNNQVNNVINSLKAIGAWDMHDLDRFCGLSGDGTVAVTELAKTFQQVFSQGAKIPLDLLWTKLQAAPFGYYNSVAAGCFIGLVMRSFVNGSFSWIDNSNNTHLPTAENLASMINKMLSGNALNNYLSSGSAVWQQFKPYVQKVFNLTPQEVVSEVEARKFAKQKIAVIGVPFWSLKYLDSREFGRDDDKFTAVKIVDLFWDFVGALSSDQERVMTDLLALFNGRGDLRQSIVKAFANRISMFSAFKNFVFLNTPEMAQLCVDLDLTDKDLFDDLRTSMQGAICLWQEEQVRVELYELARELRLVSLFKAEIGADIKTFKSLQSTLNGVFDYMKIPGSVVETLPYSWVPTLKLMRLLAKTPWSHMSDKIIAEQSSFSYVKTVWECLTKPKLLLEGLLRARGINFTSDELDWIYTNLQPHPYEYSAMIFDVQFGALCENIAYNRTATQVRSLWQIVSGASTVRDWCNKANIPITWLFNDADASGIRALVELQDNFKVDKSALKRALNFLETADFALLSDVKAITERFCLQIGEGYRAAWSTDNKLLIDRLKTNAKLTADVFSWENKIPEIRTVFDAYLQKTYKEQAQKRVQSMPERELRSMVLRVLEKNPGLYSDFLN